LAKEVTPEGSLVSEKNIDLRQELSHVEALVATLERCSDPATREAAREIVRSLLDLHAKGLEQMLELADAAGESGQTLIERFGRNPIVSNLLLLHGLHPEPAEKRAGDTLAKIRPRLHALGGDAELISCDAEAVRVRLRGDSSAADDLRSIVEESLTDSAPDIPSILFEESWDRSADGRIHLPIAHI
jgi:Fe-S cluster biogenesis protein NfuA